MQSANPPIRQSAMNRHDRRAFKAQERKLIMLGGSPFNERGGDFFVDGNRVHVRTEADQRFRKFLTDHSPPAVSAMFRSALRDGPSPGGAGEAYQYFGAELQGILNRTAPVVIECEQHCPGISRWLEVTGFGNTVGMIRAFETWAELGRPVS